jgi:DNA-directed RNA polymerase subunit M/transcription elongation factor TFIIS
MTTTHRSSALPASIADALAAGWRLGPLPWMSATDAAADTWLASELECPRCGAAGGSYRALHRRKPEKGYRAFAVCPCCGHTDEF